MYVATLHDQGNNVIFPSCLHSVGYFNHAPLWWALKYEMSNATWWEVIINVIYIPPTLTKTAGTLSQWCGGVALASSFDCITFKSVNRENPSRLACLLQKHSAAADIASTLSEDQVPEAFLVMLLIQFSTMIIDRALYLRKAVLGKLIFQVQFMSSDCSHHPICLVACCLEV